MVQGTMMHSAIHMSVRCGKDCRDDRMDTEQGNISDYSLIYSGKTGIQETIE